MNNPKFIATPEDLGRNAAERARFETHRQRVLRRRKAEQAYFITVTSAFLIVACWLVIALTAKAVTPEPAPAPTTAYIVVHYDISPSRYSVTAAQRSTLAKLAYTEARGDGIDGMVAALLVVRNRWQDRRFGATLDDICVPYQFHGLRAEHVTPHADAYNAVRAVFDIGIGDMTNGALYFCTPATDPDLIKPGLTETARIGGHVFYTDRG